VALVVLGASGPWGEMGIGGIGSFSSSNGEDAHGGRGNVGFAVYLHQRLIEDGAPYALQPYLQRSGWVAASVSASAFSSDVTGYPEAYAGNALGGSLSIDSYPRHGAFTLWVSASFARSSTSGPSPGAASTYLLPRAGIAPGLRFGDTRVNLGYRYAPTIADDVYDGRGFGEPFLSVDHVVARKVSISGLVQLILSGARGTLDIAFYPTRALGLGASFEYAEGAIYDDSHTVTTTATPSTGGCGQDPSSPARSVTVAG